MTTRFIHIAAKVGTRPPFFPNSGHKEAIIVRCKSRCVSLMSLPGVVQATVFDAVMPADHDVAVLIECESEEAVTVVEFHPAYVELMHVLRVNAQVVDVTLTSDAARVKAVERYRWDRLLELLLRSFGRARWPALYRTV